MAMFSKLDLSHGQLPPWIEQFVKVTRPLGVNMMIAIPALGAFAVGVVSYFDPAAGAAMAKNSTDFLRNIPDAADAAIATVALGYTAAKSTEAIKAPPPAGGTTPEGEELDAAPRSRSMP